MAHVTHPAMAALDRVTALCGAAMRSTVAVVGGIAALVSAEQSQRGLVTAVVVVSVCWSALFAVIALRRGLLAWLMIGDLVLTCALCLAQGRLVAAAILPGGLSWIAGLATMSIVIANFAWRPRVAAPAGLVVAASHLAGAQLAHAGDGGYVSAGIQVVQVVATGALMSVLRRAAHDADASLARSREAQRTTEALRARRAEEREQNRRMHDTVLATLTIVGTGALAESSAVLRERAAADLTVIAQVGPPVAAAVPVALHGHLRATVGAAGLPVRWLLADCEVPAPVAAALCGAALEAVSNVVRHVGATATAEVRLSERADQVLVEIADNGPGFDRKAVPAHRYGIREAIIGRMRAVGGDADVRTGPDGTTVSLLWAR
ncbi:ATP-binding protein [Dactylosporangium sp. NPDC049742]|uniref:sensor histidine kinase n=1 Tax=Dactylosporangium sp. NPDC049742 TaxID=3154737 RepID=UPI00343A6D4F